MKHILTVILFFALVQIQADHSVSIIYEKDNTFNKVEYKNVLSHEFHRKSVDSLSILKLKYVGSKKWNEVPIDGAWGFIINDGTSNQRTYRYINGKAFTLIEGNMEGNAIYNYNLSLYLYYIFIWKDTYYLSVDGQLIKLKSGKYLKQTLNGTCVGEAVSEKNRWISWWITKSKKFNGKSPLMSAIETCEATGSLEK